MKEILLATEEAINYNRIILCPDNIDAKRTEWLIAIDKKNTEYTAMCEMCMYIVSIRHVVAVDVV